MRAIAARALGAGLGSAIRLFDSADGSDGKPFSEPDILRPRVDSRRFGWVHYGVMIPDLPEPHRFFSMMSLVGATGSLAFDNDDALVAPPRRNASVVAGTAASHPAHFGNYAVGDTFVSSPDGSLVQFGDDVRLTGRFPRYELVGRLGGVDVALTLTNTPTVSWFFRSPVYKHFGLLTEYEGTFTCDGHTIAAEGLCSFEYGAMPSPYLVRSTPLSPAAKVPLDLFVYQIADLDADTQILLSHYTIGGRPLMTTAILRTRTGYGTRFRDVKFDVLELRDEPEPTPYGIPMPVPRRTRFLVKDSGGRPWLDLEATMDTPFTFGLGTGFVTGFAYSATWRGTGITGRGYFEYIDRRSAG
ncbi:DUF6670 family protein [Rhodococcus sp. NPDC047139]|uniref:DUF6670 family protein n=1 Tax=Rhodococcus sp. NPDC047139 TaxID=3155141 RepID=UPI0033E789EC